MPPNYFSSAGVPGGRRKEEEEEEEEEEITEVRKSIIQGIAI